MQAATVGSGTAPRTVMRPIAQASLLLALTVAACQPEPVPASAAEGGPEKVQAAAPITPRPAAAPTISHWQCGEILLSVTFGAHDVALAFSGRALSLPREKPGAGTDHADAAGNAFRLKGQRATLVLQGEPPRDCTVGARLSPWNEAAARGIVFRAVGNEPGWLVEVGAGATSPLHAVLDYGERTLDVARMRSTESGYRGEAGDGSAVVLEIRRDACHDGMSGEAFEASAELAIGERRYAGCGAFLAE